MSELPFDPNRVPTTPEDIRLSALLCAPVAAFYEGLDEPGEGYPTKHRRDEDEAQAREIGWPETRDRMNRDLRMMLIGAVLGVNVTLAILLAVTR